MNMTVADLSSPSLIANRVADTVVQVRVGQIDCGVRGCPLQQSQEHGLDHVLSVLLVGIPRGEPKESVADPHPLSV
jgi:hypothetical protein